MVTVVTADWRGELMIVLDSAYPVLSCVLGWAVVGKLGRLREFTGQVAAYRMLPPALVRAAALVVVSGEIAATVLLVPPATRPYGAALATALLAVFLAAQASALARGLRIDCGCFGGSDELSRVGPATITRTAVRGREKVPACGRFEVLAGGQVKVPGPSFVVSSGSVRPGR